MRFVPALLASCFCVAPLSARAIVTSGFDNDNGGWTGVTADIATSGVPVQTTPALTFHTAGGHPGGFVSMTDPDVFDMFFRAPASFLGNQSNALGGTLNFDTITDLSLDYNGADVVIKGNGTVLVYDIAPTTGNQWSTISVSLSPSANWRLNTLGGPAASVADFQNALSNVSELWITAEYHAGVAETTGLDNVTLTSVPEPATLAPALWCIGAALTSRRRVCT
jgi:Laminin B (Domain IV)